jgi:hypothetical protein
MELFIFLLFIRALIFYFKLNKEQFFENENTCDIFMTEIRMENEPLLEPQENVNLQTKGSKNAKMNEKNER